MQGCPTGTRVGKNDLRMGRMWDIQCEKLFMYFLDEQQSKFGCFVARNMFFSISIYHHSTAKDTAV